LGDDVGCICGGTWNPETGLCNSCGKVGPYRLLSYDALLKENEDRKNLLIEKNILLGRCQKYIEDAIEYVEHDDHIIAKQGRKLLEIIVAESQK